MDNQYISLMQVILTHSFPQPVFDEANHTAKPAPTMVKAQLSKVVTSLVVFEITSCLRLALLSGGGKLDLGEAIEPAKREIMVYLSGRKATASKLS